MAKGTDDDGVVVLAVDTAAAAAGAPEEAMVSDTRLLWLRDLRA